MKSVSAKQIMQSVEEAFLKSELDDKTSIEIIAKIIGYSPSSIYQYFPAKDDLFLLLLNKNKQELMIFLSEEVRNTSFIKIGFKDFCFKFFFLIATAPPLKLINFSLNNVNSVTSTEHQNKICSEMFSYLAQLAESNYNLKFAKFDDIGRIVINSQIKNLIFFDRLSVSVVDHVENKVESLLATLLKE